MSAPARLPLLGPARAGTYRRRALALVAATLVLAACSRHHDDQPGAVSADEAAQLNDAAAMLDANSVDLNAATANDQDQP